jgi:hypothetical protein
MRSTPSPRVRLLAALALILAASGIAFLLIHGSAGNDQANDTSPGTSVPVVTGPKTTPSKPQKPREKKHTQLEGVAALDSALISRPVVVVSVYAKDVSTDVQAMDEAKAGAALVGAGFVPFNVYDEKIARQLGNLLGNEFQVSTPTLLIFKRPRKLAFQLDGFADSKVVAQAAHDVFPVEEPWVSEANGICARYARSLQPLREAVQSSDLTTAAGRKSASASLERGASALDREIQDLGGIRATVTKAASYEQLVTDLKQAAANLHAEAKAIGANDLEGAQAIETKNATLAETLNTLVDRLQLTSCSA